MFWKKSSFVHKDNFLQKLFAHILDFFIECGYKSNVQYMEDREAGTALAAAPAETLKRPHLAPGTDLFSASTSPKEVELGPGPRQSNISNHTCHLYIISIIVNL